MVFGGQNYVDWLPYRHTEQRALAFFRNGSPFTHLNGQDKALIEQLLYVRNAIAHKSDHAKRMFDEKIISTLSLTPREKTPAGYLRSIFRTAPNQTRYEYLILEIAAVAQKLCNYSH